MSQKQWSNFQYLNAGVLKYANYQRPVNELKIDKIIRNFNPHLVNPLKVSYRDGQYWVYDGQHTLESHRKMKGNNDFMMACIVRHGLTSEEEARLFALQNGEATKVGASDQVKALEEAKDENTIAFLTATRESGFEIIPGKRVSRNGYIGAVAKAQTGTARRLHGHRKMGSLADTARIASDRRIPLLENRWHALCIHMPATKAMTLPKTAI